MYTFSLRRSLISKMIGVYMRVCWTTVQMQGLKQWYLEK